MEFPHAMVDIEWKYEVNEPVRCELRPECTSEDGSTVAYWPMRLTTRHMIGSSSRMTALWLKASRMCKRKLSQSARSPGEGVLVFDLRRQHVTKTGANRGGARVICAGRAVRNGVQS
jgi:hypothetical protein